MEWPFQLRQVSLSSDSSSLYYKKKSYFKTEVNFLTIDVLDSSEDIKGELNSDWKKSTRWRPHWYSRYGLELACNGG